MTEVDLTILVVLLAAANVALAVVWEMWDNAAKDRRKRSWRILLSWARNAKSPPRPTG